MLQSLLSWSPLSLLPDAMLTLPSTQVNTELSHLLLNLVGSSLPYWLLWTLSVMPLNVRVPWGPLQPQLWLFFPWLSCGLCSSLKGGRFRNEGSDRCWGRRGEERQWGRAGRRAPVSHRLVTLNTTVTGKHDLLGFPGPNDNRNRWPW